jgi:hypothetical protein
MERAVKTYALKRLDDDAAARKLSIDFRSDAAAVRWSKPIASTLAMEEL